MKHTLFKPAVTAAIMACSLLTATPAHSSSQIGTWKSYMAYHDITSIAKGGNIVYVLASNDLYMYDTSDQSITTMDKNSGLSDSSIGYIAWNATTRSLIVVYDNGNIDVIDQKGGITNISDYYNKSLTSDKTVYNVTISGRMAYLSTGFGVVAVNMANYTIADTYNLNTAVNAVAVNGNDIYAATNGGILKGDMRQNIADHSVWTTMSDSSFRWLFWKDGSLVGVNSLNISTIDASGRAIKQAGPYVGSCSMQNNIIYCYGGDDSYAYNTPSDRGPIKSALTAIAYDSSNGSYWTNDTDGTLCNMILDDSRTINVAQTGIRPDGPTYNYFGYMFVDNGMLYTSGGPGYSSRPACVQILEPDNRWNVYDDSFADSLTTRYRNAYAITLDPKDKRHVYMGAQEGLYEFYDGRFVKRWNMDNSPLWHASVKEEASAPNYVKVTALTTTPDGTLYCFNSETVGNHTSLLKMEDGDKWTSMGGSEFANSSNQSWGYVKSMFVDSRGLVWFCNSHSLTSALACYQPSTGGIKTYKRFVNQDGTAYTLYSITCAAEDNEGNIWIGTDIGPLMLPASQIGTDDDTFTQVKIPRNDGTNLADYLLSNVSITCMFVDGAGRKWFGTSGDGVYLISADNIEQLQHFTSSNSQLLADDIESITANPTTGEVFFGTANGLCSYMGDATTPADNMSKDNVYAYPNPVTPDYTGLITVTGLTLNADVKIVTANGVLVAQGRSNGGSFTWDGCDLKGKRVASGVYMVQTATASGGKGTVAKIAIIN